MLRFFTLMLLFVGSSLQGMERPPHFLPPRPTDAPPSPPLKRSYAQVAAAGQEEIKKTSASQLRRSSQLVQEESHLIIQHEFEKGLIIEELFLPYDCKYRGTDGCESQFTDKEADAYWQHIVQVHGIISARYEDNNIPLNLIDQDKK